MDILLVALQVLFFVPMLVRAAGMPGDGKHSGFVREVAAGLRKPALVFHGSGLLLLWLGLVLALLDGRVPRTATPRGLLGAAVLLCATFLMSWATATLRSWRLLPKVEAGHELCTSGPYGLVRHPIYLALDLLGIGSALWVGSATVVVAAGVLVVGGDWRARLEEKVLLESFGDRYRDYMRRVRRTIPLLY